jgi:predicted secreted Zn-dependent protease
MMTVTSSSEPIAPSTGTAAALAGLHRALDAPFSATEAGGWRWTVRRAMGPVRDALEREYHGSADGWQSARHGRSLREQAALVRRLAAYGPVVLEHPDVDEVRQGLKRLLADIDHHVQRQHDLAYDEVEQEIGGSE